MQELSRVKRLAPLPPPREAGAGGCGLAAEGLCGRLPGGSRGTNRGRFRGRAVPRKGLGAVSELRPEQSMSGARVVLTRVADAGIRRRAGWDAAPGAQRAKR